MPKVALFTVIYSGIRSEFVEDFCSCLDNQTYQDYDLIVVNDGYERSAKVLFHNVIELAGKPSVAKNREIGINYAKSHGYDYLVLCDIDDIFCSDRVEKSVKALSTADIVVNDLDIIGPTKDLLCSAYYSRSLSVDASIDLDFMLHKNIFGFSNSAINLNSIEEISLPEQLKVVDWYYFTLLIKQGLKVKIIPEPLTGYRQHGDNMIGIDDFSIGLFKKMLNLRSVHFSLLAEQDSFFSKYKEIAEQEVNTSVETIANAIAKNKEDNPNPLWWENIHIA